MGQLVSCCFDSKRSSYYSEGLRGRDGAEDEDLENGQLRVDKHKDGDGDQVFLIEKKQFRQQDHLPVTKHTTSQGNQGAEEQKIRPGQDDTTDAALEDNGAQNLAQYESAEIPEDDLSPYVFPPEYADDSDKEIEEFSRLRVEGEEVKFSKKGLTQHIENMFALESFDTTEKAKEWELKLDKQDIKVWVKKIPKGATNEHPYIKTEIFFNSAFSIQKIIEAIFNVKHRLKWDKQVKKIEETEILAPIAVVKYQVNTGVLIMNAKEFLDKQVRFADTETGTYYIYYSEVAEGTEPYENDRKRPPKTDRAATIVGVQKMYRHQAPGPYEGKVVYQMLMKCDLKINVSPKLIQQFLPNGMQDWLNKCNKYINDHYDEI